MMQAQIEPASYREYLGGPRKIFAVIIFGQK